MLGGRANGCQIKKAHQVASTTRAGLLTSYAGIPYTAMQTCIGGHTDGARDYHAHIPCSPWSPQLESHLSQRVLHRARRPKGKPSPSSLKSILHGTSAVSCNNFLPRATVWLIASRHPGCFQGLRNSDLPFFFFLLGNQQQTHLVLRFVTVCRRAANRSTLHKPKSLQKLRSLL